MARILCNRFRSSERERRPGALLWDRAHRRSPLFIPFPRCAAINAIGAPAPSRAFGRARSQRRVGRGGRGILVAGRQTGHPPTADCTCPVCFLLEPVGAPHTADVGARVFIVGIGRRGSRAGDHRVLSPGRPSVDLVHILCIRRQNRVQCGATRSTMMATASSPHPSQRPIKILCAFAPLRGSRVAT